MQGEADMATVSGNLLVYFFKWISLLYFLLLPIPTSFAGMSSGDTLIMPALPQFRRTTPDKVSLYKTYNTDS